MKYYTTAMRLKEAMEDAGKSQQQLADISQVSKSSISHYINGTNEPNNKSAYAMAQALNVNPVWLMGLDAPKYIKVDYTDNSEFITSNNESEKIYRALDFINHFDKADSQTQSAVRILLGLDQPKI